MIRQRFLFSLPVRLAAVSFMLNLATETSGVFLPLYAKSMESSNFQIGLIASVYGIAFFLSSLFFGRQSDIHGRLIFVRSGLGLSALAYLSQVFAHSPMALLAARGFVGFSLGITTAATMAYTYENQKQVGDFVSYGALGWLFGAGIAAIIRDFGPLFLASAISSALAFLVSTTFREEPVVRVRTSIFPLPVIKANRKVYLGFFIRQLGANAVWAIFPLYLASIGASRSWIAILDGINMGTQFVTMRFVERFNPVTAFRSGLVLSGIVFGIYGLANNYLQLFPVQLMLALSWAGMLIGALSYLMKKNTERGTASGLLYSTLYLSASLGPFFGGALAQTWGYVAVMFFASGMGFLSFFSSAGLKKA